MWQGNHQSRENLRIPLFFRRGAVYLICIIVLFVSISIMTTIKPAYRVSSQMITEWTSNIDSSIFLNLIGMENRAFKQALPEEQTFPDLSSTLFQVATSVQPNDPRSLLGKELPGFSTFDSRILIAGEGTDYTNLPMESSPPLEEVLKEREAVLEEEELAEPVPEQEGTPTTGERDVVFIYNSHNRESFLPHLPGVTDPNRAQHREVNITKVSDRLAKGMEANGIGTNVSDTDVVAMLNDRGMTHAQSYQASRNVVEEAFASNDDLTYIFDLHRDSVSRDITTTEINGEVYARIMFVVGAEHENYEQNLALATKFHEMIEAKYPGLSRGVLAKEGAGTNGVFNQDLSGNSLLVEFGGVGNKLEELYRSADAVADVFADYYWDAEAVNAEE
ncbi:stage II sporulation protein P [Lentibacillus sediminis]|uniref:stage II sporulation protein P n=1 Tax=Lentibacillus sediminis TaxID=1940529 RepID=UPI000C1B87D1|nr:stage II sporulation protein P [Lentibacillus sediminis]